MNRARFPKLGHKLDVIKSWISLMFPISLLFHGIVEGASAKSKVLLVSMDGFRHDYLSKTDTPNFDAMISTGVTVPYVNNSFITNTFPCHYTIATGLFSESHGIVGNKMYDPVFNSSFTKANREPRWWEGGEPVWITATKAGLKAGVYFWPGSEIAIRGVRPAIWHEYDGKVPFEDRVRAVVKWLSSDDFDLAVTYFNEPDTSGHRFGPDHPEMKAVIARMDRLLGFLLQEMDSAGLTDKVNIIVTSDHGMTTLDLDNKVVDVSRYVDSSLLHTMVDQGSTAQMIPQPGKARDLVQALSGIEHIHVMLREDIPERFHLKESRRVMDVFAYADEGWIITTHLADARSLGVRGAHGYDNRLPSMKPFFIAKGPAFKQGVTVAPIQNVDIYPLICFLLGIEPSANNGSLARAQPLLDPQAPPAHDTAPTHSWSLSSAIFTALICAVVPFIV